MFTPLEKRQVTGKCFKDKIMYNVTAFTIQRRQITKDKMASKSCLMMKYFAMQDTRPKKKKPSGHAQS